MEQKKAIFYVNGQFVPEDQALVSVYDHGFLYGDGVFDALKVYNGRIFRFDDHINRLYESAKIIGLRIPLKREEFKKVIIETVRKNGFKNAYVRPQVTRGPGLLGMDPKRAEKSTVVVYVLPTERVFGGLPLSKRVYKAIFASTRRTPPYCVPATAKATHYLNNILAKIEGNNAGVDQVIMLDSRGFVSEATAANVFMAKNNVLSTPPLAASILEGTRRRAVINIAEELKIPVKERDILPAELYVADEVFLTSTGLEISVITEIDGRIIGDGTIGPITRKLEAKFMQLVQTEGTPVYS